MHHSGQRQFGGDAVEHPGQRVPVRDVTALDGDPGAERGQLAGQVGHPGCVGAPAAEQEQVLGSSFGEQARDPPAQRSGATGDQDRAARAPLRTRCRAARVADQSATEDRRGADRHLVLTASGAGTGQHGAEP